MTDTQHISDAINGLPDYTDERKASLYYWDESDTGLAIADLKALVAENEALKEAAQSALAFMLHCDLEGLEEASKPETELLCKVLGGNDD